MRTTLDIDDEVLALAKQFAKERKQTLGEVISGWARTALSSPKDSAEYKNGFRQYGSAPGAVPMTLEEINRLRDEGE